jgi:hypothetical protein
VSNVPVRRWRSRSAPSRWWRLPPSPSSLPI